MPKEFEQCVKNGGRVRTKTLSQNRYMHICFLNGKSYAGEVKTKQKLIKKYVSNIRKKSKSNTLV